MPLSILSTDELEDEPLRVLEGYTVYEVSPNNEASAECEVLMAWPSRVKADLLSKLKSLRMVQFFSAGVDAFDFSILPSRVRVFSNAGAYTDPVAEHAWGLALGIASGIHAGAKRLPPRRLRSKTLLVLGCGAIGSEVARLGKASLGMRTIGVSRSFRFPQYFDERHPVSELGGVIGQADLVMNCLPLTRSTRSLIGAELLGRAKKNVIITNVGRGETVDEVAMLAWLKGRPDSRYATDVFWKKDGKEVFDTEAWGLPNFGGTLHTAAAQDPDALMHAHLKAAMNVRRFIDSGNAPNEVDPDEYAREKFCSS